MMYLYIILVIQKSFERLCCQKMGLALGVGGILWIVVVAEHLRHDWVGWGGGGNGRVKVGVGYLRKLGVG